MEINSGHSNVQIAIAVQPQHQPARTQEGEGNDDVGSFNAASAPSVNTSGQEVGRLINTWA